jgi:hypothetical protein
MCNWTEESILELRKDRDAMEERVKTLEVALEKILNWMRDTSRFPRRGL